MEKRHLQRFACMAAISLFLTALVWTAPQTVDGIDERFITNHPLDENERETEKLAAEEEKRKRQETKRIVKMETTEEKNTDKYIKEEAGL